MPGRDIFYVSPLVKVLICSIAVDGQDIGPERLILEELFGKRGISITERMTGINIQMTG